MHIDHLHCNISMCGLYRVLLYNEIAIAGGGIQRVVLDVVDSFSLMVEMSVVNG